MAWVEFTGMSPTFASHLEETLEHLCAAVGPSPEDDPAGVAQPVEPGTALPQAVQAMVAELRSALESRRREERLTALLGWLWDAVAEPILDHLGAVEPLRGDASDRRIWWCPSGLLSFLPLHADGYHATRDDRRPRTVLDRVISSYAPTVRTLSHVRRAARPTTGRSRPSWSPWPKLRVRRR
nr:CHAT domain-containing protein [Acrocarpospora corrugata]